MNVTPTDALNLDEIGRVKQLFLNSPEKLDMTNPQPTRISKGGKIIGRSCCVAGIVRTLHPHLNHADGTDAIAQAFGCDRRSADNIFVALFTEKTLQDITVKDVVRALDELATTGRVRRYDDPVEA